MEADIGTICIGAAGEQDGMRQPPPLPTPPFFSSSTLLSAAQTPVC